MNSSNVLDLFGRKSGPSVNGSLTTFLNPYSYLLARKKLDLFFQFENIKIDGFLLVKLLNLFLGSDFCRCSFDMTSMAPVVFTDAQIHNKSIFFIGSEGGVANKAATNFKNIYSNLSVIGSRHGFFLTTLERRQVLTDIVILDPDIVIVGMGTPYQEEFLIDLVNFGWKGNGFTCGGFFHQTVKNGVEYYPKWIDKYNLRWLYRMYDEPKLIKRYFMYYPWFLVVFIYDVARYKWMNRI